jgi:hypothetical protein
MIMSNSEAFARRLLAAAPELTPVYEEHLRDNFGETLGHVFMGDVTRWVVEACGKCAPEEVLSPPVGALLSFFEQELASGDDHADNVIALSFCESLFGEDEALEILRPQMGPRLSATLKLVRGE